jgi:hypothetical protein
MLGHVDQLIALLRFADGSVRAIVVLGHDGELFGLIRCTLGTQE